MRAKFSYLHSVSNNLTGKYKRSQAKIYKERALQYAKSKEVITGIPKISAHSRKLAEKSEARRERQYSSPSPPKQVSTSKQIRVLSNTLTNSELTETVTNISTPHEDTMMNRGCVWLNKKQERLKKIRETKNSMEMDQCTFKPDLRKRKPLNSSGRKETKDRMITKKIFSQSGLFYGPKDISPSHKNLGFDAGIDLNLHLSKSKPIINYTYTTIKLQ